MYLFFSLSPVLLLVLLHTSQADLRSLNPGDYGRSFQGDGTYYGRTEGGNCAIRNPRPKMYANLQPVALNQLQYGDSSACGACIEYEGLGQGSGGNPIPRSKRLGYVMDKCPGCAAGDIDLSMSGDGRWKVKWRFVPCPGNTLSFLFEGSNYHYWKMQPRGLRSPVRTMSVRIGSQVIHGKRTDDNFFVFNSGAGFRTPAQVVITTVLNARVTAMLGKWVPDGIVYPYGQSNSGGNSGNNNGGGRSQPNRKPNPPSTRAPPRSKRTRPFWKPIPYKCVPKHQHCAGSRNRWGTSRCCGPYHCVVPKGRPGQGRKCLPILPDRPDGKKHCTPKWRACTGPKNYWRTRRCCGGYVCVPPKNGPFIGKRCEPRT